MRKEAELEVAGRKVKVSNLDKVLYPATGFRKADVIDYYIRISPVLLPHLRGRPLTLKRYPEGVDGGFFYEKQCPAHRPRWVKTAAIWSERKQETINYCVADDLPTLVWAANLADIELHTFLFRCRQPERPTMMVFDLDPGPPAHLLHCVRVAGWVREKLTALGLQAFPKTSGSKGLQICVPLNTPVTFDQTKLFARTLAELLTREHPREVVFLMRKDLRRGKVLIDWSQNDDHKTTVCVYSLRARERPTVSTPVTWEELAAAGRKGRADLLDFVAPDVLRRVEARGDLFAPVLTLKQKLPRWRETELSAQAA